jgi:hypothetical protein
MTFFEKVGYYYNLTMGVHEYLHTPMSTDWEGPMRRQLENREANWLDTIHRAIFSRPEHPYSQMFQLAACSYGDLTAAVTRDGLEPTLKVLQRAGVYLSHDEFKGKEPIVRSGKHIPSDENSFANPLVPGGYESRSSGSRSRGTRTRKSAAFRMYAHGYHALRIREFGLSKRVHIIVKPILPGAAGITGSTRLIRFGCRVERWYAAGGRLPDSAHYRALTNYLVMLARLHGVRIPFPTHLPSNDFSPAAALIAERLRAGVECVVNSSVSPAVRVAAAALDNGWDISGTLFLVGGEALTDPKRRLIESAGCQVFAGYVISELGPIGYGCRQMTTGNCVHLFHDSVAVIQHRRLAPLSDVVVDSLMFTSLLPTAPYLLINAEMDDAGVVEQARCDCTFSTAGFREQVRDIGSFGKLTGQGMTLVGTHVVSVLEQVLPVRFGGAPTDYQLVEQEGPNQTQLVLRVSPRVRASSPEKIKDVFLHEIRRYQGGAIASRLWRHTDALQVTSAEPLVTSTGKVLPLHLLSASHQVTHVS